MSLQLSSLIIGYSGRTASPELLKQEIDAYIEFKRTYKERKEADKKAATTTTAAEVQEV
ncbi:MAG: hypothetical protein AAGB31_11035 [Bdellovibrio sp.]